MSNYTIEERSNIVKKIVALDYIHKKQKDYTPDTLVYWRGENKEDGKYTKTYCPQTGKVTLYGTQTERNSWGRSYYWSPSSECGKYVVTSARNCVLTYYAIHYPKYDCLEVGMLTMPANRGKDGEKRTWDIPTGWYNARVFIFKQQIEVFTPNGEVYKPECHGRYYNKQFSYLMNYYGQQGQHNQKFETEIQKFTGAKNFMHRRYESTYSCPWSLAYYYENMMPRPTSKRAKDLSSLGLPDISEELSKKYKCKLMNPNAQYRWQYRYTNNIVIAFRIINDDEGVFRYFRRVNNDDGPLVEQYRLIINRKGVPTLMENNGGDWKITSNRVGNVFYMTSNTSYDGLEDMEKVAHLKYIAQIVSDEKQRHDAKQRENNYFTQFNIPECVTDLLRHPVVEKLWKSGYKSIARAIRENNTVAASFLEVFGKKEKKSGSITEITGLNKYQLKKLDVIAAAEAQNEDNYYYRRGYLNRINNIIRTIQKLTNVEISTFSNETTDKYFEAANMLNKKIGSGWKYNLLYTVNENGRPCRPWNWRREQEKPLSEEDMRRMNRIIRLGSKNPEAYKLFSDTVGTYCNLNNEYRPDIQIYDVDSYEELIHIHDELNRIYSVQQTEERRLNALREDERNKEREKKMKKIQEKRIEDYEENGSEFSVVVPRHLSQLTTEGAILSHCVGGYLERYASGDTNILFIRKNSDMTTPFYTMEVRNGQVIQIHGKCNRWLGNNPEVIPFIKQWLEKRHISYRKEQLLETAAGYGSTGRLIDGAAYGL